MKIELEDSDIDRIAAAVVAGIAAAGGTVTAKGADAPKDGKAATGGKAGAKGKVKREDVLAKVRELGEKKGKATAKEEVAKFSESGAFGDVPDDKLGDLLAAVTAALSAEAAPPASDDDF